MHRALSPLPLPSHWLEPRGENRIQVAQQIGSGSGRSRTGFAKLTTARRVRTPLGFPSHASSRAFLGQTCVLTILDMLDGRVAVHAADPFALRVRTRLMSARARPTLRPRSIRSLLQLAMSSRPLPTPPLSRFRLLETIIDVKLSIPHEGRWGTNDAFQVERSGIEPERPLQ